MVQIVQPEQEWMASKNEQSLTKISEKYTLKRKVHVGVQLIQQGKEWLKKQANIVKKALKIPNQKGYHKGPTNSMGKSFSNRNEFTLVAVG